jgi:hypothetical protein
LAQGCLTPHMRVNLSLTGIRLLTADKEHRINTPVLNKKQIEIKI